MAEVLNIANQNIWTGLLASFLLLPARPWWHALPFYSPSVL
jgi:hypothetical protein